MGKIVLGIGTSHSPMLNSLAEDFVRHAEIDQGKSNWQRELYDKDGRKCSYEYLLSVADPKIKSLITIEKITNHLKQCQAAIERIQQEIHTANLDTLVIIGDDQREQFFEDNMPAILIYWGKTIKNYPLQIPQNSPPYWIRARAQYHEEKKPKEYPVDSDLGLNLINYLTDHSFDISQSTILPKSRGEGHAFGFVHKRLLKSKEIPVVPIILNTYYPPNQPTAYRCHVLGQALRTAIENNGDTKRIGVIASGGLSHFLIDENLDRKVLAGCRVHDAKMLSTIPSKNLVSGNSEIRNWIAMDGASEHLKCQWQEYIPCYRSEAATGCGMGFAVWRNV